MTAALQMAELEKYNNQFNSGKTRVCELLGLSSIYLASFQYALDLLYVKRNPTHHATYHSDPSQCHFCPFTHRSKFSFLKSKFAISIYWSSSPNLSHTLQFGNRLWQNTFCSSSDTFWGAAAIFLVTFQYQYSTLTLLWHRWPFSSSGTILLC